MSTLKKLLVVLLLPVMLAACTNMESMEKPDFSGIGDRIVAGAKTVANTAAALPKNVRHQYVIDAPDARLYQGSNTAARAKAFDRCWADAERAAAQVKSGNKVKTVAGAAGGGAAGYGVNLLRGKSYIDKLKDYPLFTVAGAAIGFGVATALNANLQTEVAEPIMDACMSQAGFRWTGPPHAWVEKSKKKSE